MQSTPTESLSQGIWDASASRYFIVAGTVVLLYDHLRTLPDEYRFVWKANPSFAKYAFLLNRYSVVSVMVLILPATCGFGATLSTIQCQCMVFTAGMTSVLSMAIANALILLRVLVLWQDNRNVTRILWGGYLISVLVSGAMMLLTCAKALPGVHWSPITNTCVPAMKGSTLPATYGAPLFFELIAIFCVAYHALSTPRTAQMALTSSLRQHGLAFFIVVFALRLGAMFIAVYIRPSLVFLTLFFTWSTITVHLNHSILRLRRADVERYLLAGKSAADRVASPFALYRTEAGPDFDQDVLDEFDDLKTKLANKLKLQPMQNPCQRPRVITIYLGGTGPVPQERWAAQSWHV